MVFRDASTKPRRGPSIRSRIRRNGRGQLDRPEGVTVRGDHVWVSDTYNHRILLFKRWASPRRLGGRLGAQDV